ncbi:uncharacterized protein [Haliotis asinina]|uniref:uncharacterized protein isoform X3 n=1 Tax=Haliotis asinina TaxID=109174 RepID=UPI003531A04F
METQYSMEFFTSFVEQLQNVCRNYLHFSQFVEVSGYVCVEIDNLKKERYVLSELLQSSGNVVSESYCTKSFKTNRNLRDSVGQFGERSLHVEQNTRDGHSGFGRSKQNFRSPESVPQTTEREDLVYTVHYQESQPGPLKKQRTISRQDTCDSIDGGWVVDQLVEERVILPQTSIQDGTEPSTSRSTSAPSNQELPLPQDDEVIDLDLFEDDLDVAMEDERSRNVLSSGQAFAPVHSVYNVQRKRGHLSPASIATMRYTVKQFQRFLFNKCNQDIDLFSTTPEKLNELLLDFFKEAKKVNSTENLRPRSLKNVQTCLDKFLRDGGYPYSVLRDQQFHSSREYLKKKLNDSVATCGTNTVSECDIESMFQMQLLGPHNAESLTNTMWFLNSKFFILKHPVEHQNLKWGDINLRMDDNGQEYLERSVGGRYILKVYSKPAKPDRCYVNFYKQYRALRPKIALDREYSFYLRVDESDDKNCWFMPEPVHLGTLTCIWKKILIAAHLPGNKRII